MKAVLCKEFGPPETLIVEDIPSPEPGPGQVVLDVHAAAVNFPDTLIIENKYQFKPPLPFSPGGEVAGVVSKLGEGASMYKIGDRVIGSCGHGGFVEELAIPETSCIPVPDAMDLETASALVLTYGTSYYALKDRAYIKPGENLLVMGAAGGVGLIACQWAKHLGVSLIGTASTPEKCQMARDYGAQDCVLSGYADLAEKLKALAPDGGYPVVYDSVGKDTYRLGLDVLAPLGTFASFGNASGAIEAVSPQDLAAHGSLKFTRPTLATYMGQPGWMQKSSAKVLQLVQDGVLSVEINQRYALADAPRVHQDLEARATTGCSIITP